MEKSIEKQIEAVNKAVMASNGDIITIWSDPEKDETLCSLHCHDKETVMAMFMRFFNSNPELVPAVLHAAALSMDCSGDCENCQLCDNDDGEEEDDDDTDVVCMN